MQFIRRVRAVWSWLPAFRAVAETEHLPTAAFELGVVPSSLSRTIRLVEDELGVLLFNRTGNAMVLNDAGRALLGAVREAMRIVDESLLASLSDELRGNVSAVACADLVHALVLPACAALANQHHTLCVQSLVAPDESVTSLLLRGDADVALMLQPPDHPELRISELATWTRSAYATAAAESSPRCVVVGSPSFHHDDGWPAGIERTVAAWACDESAALDLAARTTLVCVAFDPIARASRHGGRLLRLATPVIAPRTVFLVHRRAVGTHRRTDALVAALRSCAAQLSDLPGRGAVS